MYKLIEWCRNNNFTVKIQCTDYHDSVTFIFAHVKDYTEDFRYAMAFDIIELNSGKMSSYALANILIKRVEREYIHYLIAEQ